MTRINLLPWREARRKQKQRTFFALLIAAGLLAALGIGGIHQRVQAQIEHQETRNQYLRAEIARLKRAAAEIKELDEARTRLLARLEVIQNLQRRRPDMVRVFDALVRLLPENIYLTSLKTEGRRITLKGIASSNNAISNFMRHLSDSPLFGEPVLRVVETEQVRDTDASIFELVVDRPRPGDGQTEAEPQ